MIANSSYPEVGSLDNPAADARLVAASLKIAGFDVEIRFDLGKAAMESELRAFGERSERADVALIYYAGHGIEAGGTNYLIPSDARLARDRDLEIEAVRLDTAMLMTEPARLRIVILDACRNNPFATKMQRTIKTRSIGRGLAEFEPEGESLVVYAAKAGATAADGEGDNSPFAVALAKRLIEPGLEISLLFRKVRDDVLESTGSYQEPYTYGSLSGNTFYFIPPPTQTAENPRMSATSNLPTSTEIRPNSADDYFSKGADDYDRKNYTNAKMNLEKGCDLNSGGACDLLATIYKYGFGKNKDIKRSFSFFEKACGLGVYSACTEQGLMYLYPNSTGSYVFLSLDQKKSYELFKIACTGGDPAGCTNLAFAFETATGVVANRDRARLYYTQACRMGETTACKRLVGMFESGQLPLTGMQEAVDLRRQACLNTPTSQDCMK